MLNTISEIIKLRLYNNWNYTPIDLDGFEYDNSDNSSYIRVQIEFTDRSGFTGGGNRTHILGLLLITVLVPYGEYNTELNAYDYASKISDLFNFYDDGNQLEFEETNVQRIGQVNNKWYQINTTTEFEYSGCSN